MAKFISHLNITKIRPSNSFWTFISKFKVCHKSGVLLVCCLSATLGLFGPQIRLDHEMICFRFAVEHIRDLFYGVWLWFLCGELWSCKEPLKCRPVFFPEQSWWEGGLLSMVIDGGRGDTASVRKTPKYYTKFCCFLPPIISFSLQSS